MACPGMPHGKAFLAFEVYESYRYDDTDVESKAGVCVWEGPVRVVRRGVVVRRGLRSLFGASGSIEAVVVLVHEWA